MENIYVLKDQDNNFLSSNSIHYNQSTNQLTYTYCKTLLNGFYSYHTMEMAKTELDLLNQQQARFQLQGKSLRVIEIPNRREILLEESKHEISRHPFITEYFDFKDDKDYVWVIRDTHNNIVNAKSVRKFNSKTWHYLSFKSFSQECRAYVDIIKAKTAMDKLSILAQKMGLDEQFRLEYVDFNTLLDQHKASKGDNMVLVEKQVS